MRILRRRMSKLPTTSLYKTHSTLAKHRVATMSYIPPGWTRERLAAASVNDLSELPHEVCSYKTKILNFFKLTSPSNKTLHRIPSSFVSSQAQGLLAGLNYGCIGRCAMVRMRFKVQRSEYRKISWIETFLQNLMI